MSSPPTYSLFTKFSKNFLYNNDSPELFTADPNAYQKRFGLGKPITYSGSPRKGMKGVSSTDEKTKETIFIGKNRVKLSTTKQPVLFIYCFLSLTIYWIPYNQMKNRRAIFAMLWLNTVSMGVKRA